MAVSSKIIFRNFKIRGLGIRADAVKALISVLSNVDDVQESLSVIIDSIKEKIQRRELNSSMIDKDTVTAIVADLSKDEAEMNEECTQYLDAFETPRLLYDPTRRTLQIISDKDRTMFAQADWKPRLFRERFLLIHQRLLRNDLFTAPTVTTSKKTDHYKLTNLDSLLGSSGTRWLFGLLTQVEEGSYYLEDLSTHVRLDISEANTTSGFFTENCFVIVEGEMKGDAFHVKMMGMPPAETRFDALHAILGGPFVDLFGKGGAAAGGEHQLAKLKGLEKEATGSMFIILSDVHLDKPQVLEKLRVLFAGYAGVEPVPLFILMGNFASKPASFDADGIQQLSENFAALANLLGEFPVLCEQGRFVFVPGPADLGSGNILPRKTLPSYLVRPLEQKLRHVVFASNPCRLRFYTQEIVLFREDILKKMQRNCIIPMQFENPDNDITETLVKTLLDQGHLCPLPLKARPIYWQHDSALQLYPLPHAVILADHTDQYCWRYEDCTALNPGSFPSDFSFVVYRPSLGETEFSRVN